MEIRQRENSFQACYSRYIAKDPDNKHLRRKRITAVAAEDGTRRARDRLLRNRLSAVL